LDSKIVNSFKDINVYGICKLPLITVYNSPNDFPGKYVARLWDVNKATEYAMVKDTLQEIRANIPPIMAKLLHSPGDDPVIIETWL
jgi:hypothetical protein